MAEESFQEKTESPSPRREQEARDKGQVARSRELSTGMVLLASAGGLMAMGPGLYRAMAEMLEQGLHIDRQAAFDPALMLTAAAAPLSKMAVIFTPLALLLLLAVILPNFLVGGWIFSSKALMPDFSRLSPAKGLGRMFSKHALMELVKAILKLLAVGGVALWVLWDARMDLVSLANEPFSQASTHLGSLALRIFLILAAATALVVAVDVPFQLWSHHQQLKMTKEEVRQESKESDGDPHVKGRIRALQREAARKRMMSEIPTADVVVTNPTHFAVALRYKDGGMRAPQVVAMGADFLAARIREVAQEHYVPILEAPPLARALYHNSDIGQEIPAALYTAVAEVLAYVYQLRVYKQQGGAAPQAPRELDVPADLDPLSNAQ
ncbi:flagellar biosynthesis protein FlhB [Thermithiobacillus plumbiphilus]|uniref:Flagellar biosynthetic protein FlhB n=1 Tax=Thermithiobacillus plumbiphilus TaxID=1729899 RepID=A0ABU9DAK2_9PROT